MTEELEALTQTVRLRGFAAPSCVLFGPIATNLGQRRALSARHTEFYRRRAAGGVGLIVTEIASVHPSDQPYELAPLASECGPGWSQIAEACSPHGTLVIAGLGHAGGQGVGDCSDLGQRDVLWAPSSVADPVSREVPYAIEQPQIDELITGFAEAAALAVSSGCCGVEVNAGQHSILRQFLSRLTNSRRDGYGRDPARLLTEVVTQVRSIVGDQALLGLRLCVDELAPWAGITPEQAAAVLADLASLLDYVVPVRGSGLSVSATRPDLHTPPGFNRELCAAVRAGLRADGHELAVVLQGSVVDVAMAGAALLPDCHGDQVADLVEMTRASLAAPELVALVRALTPDRIRPCTLSNQHSWVHDQRNVVISDEAEPSTGHETEDVELGTDFGLSLPLPAAGRAGVLVVGGGPAGLEAARVAALLGHRVKLVEASDWLGGALRPAAAIRGRGRFGLLADWLVAEVYRLGVIVRTGVRIGLEELDTAVEDGLTVLMCTGSRPARPGFIAGSGVVVRPAAEFETDVLGAVSAAEVLAELSTGIGPGLVAGELEVLVHDPVGDWTGVGIAEQVAAVSMLDPASRSSVSMLDPASRSSVSMLDPASRSSVGLRATVVTPDSVAGSRLRTGDLVDANGRLARFGVRRELFARLLGVCHGQAELIDVHTEHRRSIRCDVVIDCAQRLPEDGLWLSHPELARAGDCVAPRTVYEAILEGRRIAQQIGTQQIKAKPPAQLAHAAPA